MQNSKPQALAAGTALVAAVLWPARQHGRADLQDGFPLSCYPMFTARRRKKGTVVHLVGVGPDGGQQVLSHKLAGSGGLNQVRRQLTLAARDGRAEQVLARVARRPEAAGLVEVLLVSSTFRYDAFFAGDRTPVREVVHAAAAVPAP